MSPRSPRRRRLIAWRPPDAWRLTPSLILVLVVSFFAFLSVARLPTELYV